MDSGCSKSNMQKKPSSLPCALHLHPVFSASAHVVMTLDIVWKALDGAVRMI